MLVQLVTIDPSSCSDSGVHMSDVLIVSLLTSFIDKILKEKGKLYPVYHYTMMLKHNCHGRTAVQHGGTVRRIPAEWI